jgi:hypothetical protein
MRIRDKVTTEGGSRGYEQVYSKIAKDEHGKPKRITVAREKLIQKLGRDPGYNVVAMHVKDGSHFEKDGGAANWGTRGENTAESNKHRARNKIRNSK